MVPGGGLTPNAPPISALSSAMRTIVYIEFDDDDRMTVRDLGSGLVVIMPPIPESWRNCTARAPATSRRSSMTDFSRSAIACRRRISASWLEKPEGRRFVNSIGMRGHQLGRRAAREERQPAALILDVHRTRLPTHALPSSVGSGLAMGNCPARC